MTGEKAITPYTQLRDMARTESVQERFMQLLGDEGLPFIASVLTVVAESDRLMECDPASIWTAAAQAATYKLTVNPAIGWAYLVPYKKKATFQIGYKGYIQLAMRTNKYEKIHAGPIYEGQIIIEDQMTGDIRLEGARTSDEAIGYFAYFRLIGGYEKFTYMSDEEIRAHAEKYSQSYGKNWSSWTKAFEAMAMKTVLKRLLSRYGIMSIDLKGAMSADENGEEKEPAFDIDVQFTEQEDNGDNLDPESEKPNGERKWSAKLLKYLVTEKVAMNQFEAKGCLNLSQFDPKTVEPEQAKSWLRIHQGWKDSGKTTVEAAELTNKGEVPK